MTDEAKKTISELRIQGLGYKKIAKETGLNAGTVKSYCIRHGLGRGALPVKPNILPTKPCDYCGGVVTLYPGRKVPRFCCSACRIKWWNKHLSESNRLRPDQRDGDKSIGENGGALNLRVGRFSRILIKYVSFY